MVSQLQIDAASKVKAYISNVEQFLEQVKMEHIDKDVEKLIDLAKAYLDDSKYYLAKGDYFTSLACIAYAEGLLDSLRIMGKITGVNWRPLSELTRRPRVVVAGSFEFLHPGHIELFKKAWEHGEVYVIVSRDENFERFKGRKPALRQEDRLTIVESLRYVTKAIMGDRDDLFKPIIELKPDIVLLGPDQWIDPDTLRQKLEERGLQTSVLKLERRIGNYSSSNMYNELRKNICGDS